MSSKTGVLPIGVYTSTSVKARLQALQALIPNPDVAMNGTGSVAGGGNLDEMSPGAATQLQVELDSLVAATPIAYGQYTTTAGDATATFMDIVTGLGAAFTLANVAVSIRRAGSLVSTGVLTTPVAGTLHIAAGGVGTLVVTAGDVVSWLAY